MANKAAQEKFYDVLIVGAGPVGLFAVFALGMKGLKTCVVDTLGHAGGQCAALYPEKNIYDIPAHVVISGQKLIDNLQEQIKPFNPDFYFEYKVSHINKENDFFNTTLISNHAHIPCKNIKSKFVFIATGGGCFEPNKPTTKDLHHFEQQTRNIHHQEHLNGVFYSIPKQNKMHHKDIVIIGGGDSALDWALQLKNICKSVTLVHRSQKLRAHIHTQNQFHEAILNGKIVYYENSQVTQCFGRIKEQQNINILDKILVLQKNNENIYEHIIPCDVLLPFLGVISDSESIQGLIEQLFHKKTIPIEVGTAETKIEGIYAIGDIAFYTGKKKLISLGFAECEWAAYHCYEKMTIGHKKPMEHSTSRGVIGF